MTTQPTLNSIPTSYQGYLNLYNDSNFRRYVTNAYTAILNTFSDDETSQKIISGMVGNSYSVVKTNTTQINGTSQISVTPINTPTPSQFYIFWNNNSNVLKSTDIIKAYITGSPSNNDNLYSQYSYANAFITFILSFFFSTNQFTDSGGSTSFPPNIVDTSNNQKAVINIKNFIQNTVSPEFNNTVGCGNFSFKPNVTLDTVNNGFIKNLCQNTWDNFKNQPTYIKLNPEQQINSYRNLISQNETLLAYCGCYAPLPPFHQTALNSGTSLGESPCDPLCYNSKSISLFDISFSNNDSLLVGGTIEECNSEVCVIDNVSINSLNSNGNINFNQTCNGCKTNSSGCLCFIDVSTQDLINKISYRNSGMMTQQKFTQNCSGNSTCFRYDNGEIQEVECNKFNTPLTGSAFSFTDNGFSELTTPKYIPDFFWFFVTIIFFLLFLLVYQVSDY